MSWQPQATLLHERLRTYKSWAPRYSRGVRTNLRPRGPGSLGSTMSTRRNGSVESSLGGSCTCPKRQIAEDSTLMRWAYLDIPWTTLGSGCASYASMACIVLLVPQTWFLFKKIFKVGLPQFHPTTGKRRIEWEQKYSYWKATPHKLQEIRFFQKSVPRKRFPISGHIRIIMNNLSIFIHIIHSYPINKSDKSEILHIFPRSFQFSDRSHGASR